MFKKINIKSFVLGAFCMTVLMGTPQAYGAVKEYILQPAQFNVYLNGNEYKDDNPVLVYEGNTYIPLRAFCDRLGLNLNLNFNDYEKRVNVNTVNGNMDNFSLPDNTPFGEGEITINGCQVKYGIDTTLNTEFVEANNKRYISQAYVFQSIAKNGKVYMFMRENDKNGKEYIYMRDGGENVDICIAKDLYLKEIISDEILVRDIPTVIFKNREFIEYDFYLKNIKDI
jgi:hypothetical protein